jgi:hypothetical protein
MFFVKLCRLRKDKITQAKISVLRVNETYYVKRGI